MNAEDPILNTEADFAGDADGPPDSHYEKRFPSADNGFFLEEEKKAA